MVQDGDVIAFDYDLFVEGQGEVFDTTLRETAEKAGRLDPQAYYAPMHYILGSGRLIKGLEEALKTYEIGKTKSIELPIEQAYGPRDPKLIETIPIQEFKRNKIEPEVGLVINYKQRRGTVTYVGGGRIRVDFNHPLAGKKLTYVVTLRSVARDTQERIRGVIQMDYPAPWEWTIEASGDEATIHVPEQAKFDQNFLVAKYRILSDLRRIAGLKTVKIVESFAMKEATQAAPTPPAA